MSFFQDLFSDFQERPVAQQVGLVSATLAGALCIGNFLGYLKWRTKEKSHRINAWSTSDEAIDGANLTGKLAIVTGCNGGIGKETVRILVKQGCNVIMACRNENKAKAAKADILNSLGLDASNNEQIEIVTVDVSSLNSVKQFAQTINSRNIKIDYLINNAGIMALPKYEESADGYEMQFATNHVGHFYLTNLLMPSILRTTKSGSNGMNGASSSSSSNDIPRIINVSSTAHRLAPNYDKFNELLDYCIENKCFMGDRRNKYDAMVNYGISKAANILFTRELQKKYGKDKLIAVTLHPGVINTDLARYMNPIFKVIMLFIIATRPAFYFKNFKSISQGAATTLRCVSLSNDEINPAGYYFNCHENVTLGPCKEDEPKGAIAEKLWQLSEILVKEKGLELDNTIG